MQQFEIAFSGQIVAGAQLEQVKVAVAKIFQADAALLTRLFSGQRVVIKKQLDAAAVAKYQAAFERAGAVLEVRDLFQSPVEEIVLGLPPEELTAGPKQAPAEAGKMLQVTPRDLYMAVFSDVQALDFGLAQLGDDLQSEPAEVPAPDLDLSALSLAPVGSDISQLTKADEVFLADISYIKLLDD